MLWRTAPPWRTGVCLCVFCVCVRERGSRVCACVCEENKVCEEVWKRKSVWCVCVCVCVCVARGEKMGHHLCSIDLMLRMSMSRDHTIYVSWHMHTRWVDARSIVSKTTTSTHIVVILKDNQDGWLFGRSGSEEGLFSYQCSLFHWTHIEPSKTQGTQWNRYKNRKT